MMMTHDKTLTEAGAMTIPEVINIRKQLTAAEARVAELEAEATRLRQELEVQQGRAKTLLNRNSAQAARMRALLARAEAAEAERNELRERHDNLKTAYANLVEEAAGRLVRRLVRMYAAERRVAALEAQLAAQGWRPVTITEPPPDAAEQEAVNKAEREVAALRRRIDEAERQTERE